MKISSKQQSLKWTNILCQNQVFSLGVILYVIVLSVLLAFFTDTGDGILFFSNHRSPAGDTFFVIVTQLGEEIAFGVATIALLFVRIRYALLMPLAGLSVMAFVYPVKRFFYHPRPQTYFDALGEFDTITLVAGADPVSGHSSFPSGHTMGAFVLFGILAFIFTKKRWGILFFTLAALVGVSRVYLVQHFLKDILLGGVLGFFWAWGLFYFFSKWKENEDTHWLNRSLIKVFINK